LCAAQLEFGNDVENFGLHLYPSAFGPYDLGSPRSPCPVGYSSDQP
jgi:hypothetical protein